MIKNKDYINLIICKVTSEEEFNKIKALLLKNGFYMGFNYENLGEYLSTIFIRIATKDVTYSTNQDILNGDFENNLENRYSVLFIYYDVYIAESYDRLKIYFEPLSMKNYFDRINVYESHIIKKFNNYNK